jgi:hypothetical protein
MRERGGGEWVSKQRSTKEGERGSGERNPADKDRNFCCCFASARSLPRKKLGKKTHESSGILDGEERREGIKWEERIKSSGVVVVL